MLEIFTPHLDNGVDYGYNKHDHTLNHDKDNHHRGLLMTPIRLIDIAEKVGVSHTAVSKVLNGLPIRIGAEKRQKIMTLAEELGYRPNIIARSLQGSTTKSIGVVIPNVSTLFYPSLVQSIEMTLSACGYQTMICNTLNDPSVERRHIEDLASRLVDGFIVSPVSRRENIDLLSRIHESARPLVLIDRYLPETDLHFIVTNNIEGAGKAVALLADQGVATLYYLGERIRNQAIEDRLEGVRREASNRGMLFSRKKTFFCDGTRDSVRNIFGGIFKKRAENIGVFLESNRHLMGVLDAARDNGLAIPDDLRVVGFDEFTPHIRTSDDLKSLHVLRNPVPFIEQDIAGMGRLSCDFLMSSFNGKSTGHVWQIKLPAKLLIPK